MSTDPLSPSFSFKAFMKNQAQKDKNRETKRAARKRKNEIAAAGKNALQPPIVPGEAHRAQANFKLGNRPREFSSIAKKQISGNLGRELRAKEERERLEKAVGVLNNDENNSPRHGRPELNSPAAAPAAAAPVPVVPAPAPAPAPRPVLSLGPAAGSAGGAGWGAMGKAIPVFKVGEAGSSSGSAPSSFITSPPRRRRSTRRRNTRRRR